MERHRQAQARCPAVLLLHYEHEYSDSEIAEMRGESRSKIASMLSRAREQLKEILAKGD